MKSPENKIGQVNGVAATKAAAPKALKTREQREQEAIEAMRVVTNSLQSCGRPAYHSGNIRSRRK